MEMAGSETSEALTGSTVWFKVYSRRTDNWNNHYKGQISQKGINSITCIVLTGLINAPSITHCRPGRRNKECYFNCLRNGNTARLTAFAHCGKKGSHH